MQTTWLFRTAAFAAFVSAAALAMPISVHAQEYLFRYKDRGGAEQGGGDEEGSGTQNPSISLQRIAPYGLTIGVGASLGLSKLHAGAGDTYRATQAASMPGMSVNSSTGHVSGTPSAAAGTEYTFQVEAVRAGAVVATSQVVSGILREPVVGARDEETPPGNPGPHNPNENLIDGDDLPVVPVVVGGGIPGGPITWIPVSPDRQPIPGVTARPAGPGRVEIVSGPIGTTPFYLIGEDSEGRPVNDIAEGPPSFFSIFPRTYGLWKNQPHRTGYVDENGVYPSNEIGSVSIPESFTMGSGLDVCVQLNSGYSSHELVAYVDGASFARTATTPVGELNLETYGDKFLRGMVGGAGTYCITLNTEARTPVDNWAGTGFVTVSFNFDSRDGGDLDGRHSYMVTSIQTKFAPPGSYWSIGWMQNPF